MKQRVWELDAFRGLCILGMLVIHFIFDLVSLYGVVAWEYPPLFSFVQNWGGVLFILVSGICATLGSRSVRRGLIVFSCGMVFTAVTLGMYLLGLAHPIIIIYFGVLHCLGVCMILWHFLKRLPTPWLVVLGAAMAVLGLWLKTVYWDFPWLIPLGFVTPEFMTSDYFPLLPHLGFFLLGAALGRTLYRNKTTLFPRVNENDPLLRFLTACGRHSLWIYLLHQPAIALIVLLISILLR